MTIDQWTAYAPPDTACVNHFFPIQVKRPQRRSLGRCATSCIEARFAYLLELMRRRLVASLCYRGAERRILPLKTLCRLSRVL